MKRFFWAAAAAVVVAGAAPTQVSAQLPVIPAVPVVPAAPVAPAGVAAPGPRVGIFQRMKLGMGGCLEKIRNTPLGQLLNNATKPLSMLTGGVIPTLDRKPTDAETKQPGVAGAAALGKKDAAEAAQRRAAVKFLGTLDCRYYPEASGALSAALRTDPSECVRYEAALALSRGCCCNKLTLLALAASVSGMDADGNPGERSARVRCTAAVALEKCLACYKEVGPPVETPVGGGGGGETGGEGGKGKADTADDGKNKLAKGDMGPPSAKDVERAREILAAFQDAYATAEAMNGTAAASGARHTSGILEVGGNEPRTPAVSNAAFRTPTGSAPATPTWRTPDPVVAAKPVVPAPAPSLTPPPAPAVSRVKFKPEADPMPAAPPVTGPVVPAVDPAPKATEPTLTPTGAGEDADAKAVEGLIHKVLLSEAAADQHAAIRDLVKYDWTAHPVVASCLVAGAKSTADAAVRVDCIRHMAHYQMAHKDVLAALEGLATDSDQWVKDEAAKALETLKK